jgi:hypothetical protein
LLPRIHDTKEGQTAKKDKATQGAAKIRKPSLSSKVLLLRPETTASMPATIPGETANNLIRSTDLEEVKAGKLTVYRLTMQTSLTQKAHPSQTGATAALSGALPTEIESSGLICPDVQRDRERRYSD